MERRNGGRSGSTKMGITHRTAEDFWSEDVWLQDLSQLFPKVWLQGFFGARPTLVLKHGWLTETALIQGLCDHGSVVLCSHRQTHIKTGCLQWMSAGLRPFLVQDPYCKKKPMKREPLSTSVG